MQVRKKASAELKQTLQPIRHDVSHSTSYKIKFHILPTCTQDLLDDEDLLGDVKEKQSHYKEEEDEVGDPKSLLGSHRDLYGGSCHLLADQFELHSQVAKKHQMVLLEVSLH